MTVKDPVCGMQIEKEDAVARVEYNGKAYYFCSEDCSSEFEDNPEDYADEGGVVE
jgi:YHS domain-containing protein